MNSPGILKINVIELRNNLRQIMGNLDKFQYSKVDSVITADLHSGKDEAKARRKACNKSCDEIREKGSALLKALDSKIESMPEEKKKGGCEVA